MYVRDTTTNTIYFSEYGYERAIHGSDVNWTEVAEDLLAIISASGGAVGLTVVGIIFYYVGIAGWALDFLLSED